MLKEERYDKILAILEEEQYISATRLSQMLYVSLPTIRRDLADCPQPRRRQKDSQRAYRRAPQLPKDGERRQQAGPVPGGGGAGGGQ